MLRWGVTVFRHLDRANGWFCADAKKVDESFGNFLGTVAAMER